MYHMSSDSDSDSDKEQKAKEQIRLAQIQKTVKKFDAQVIFRSDKSLSDNDFIHYEYDLDLKNYTSLENFISGKTQMIPYTGPLKNFFKLNESDQTSIEVKNDAQTAEQKILQKSPQILKTTGTHIIDFPQTAIGYIQVEFQDGTIQRGSGSMVGPNHVLTSARNVIDAKNIKNQIQSIHFWAGLKGKQPSFKEVSVARVILLDKFKTSPHPSIQRDELDFSILILSESLGISTGWFGLLNPENLQAIGKNYEVHGYPVTNPEPIQAELQGHGLKLEEHKENFFIYDTAAGAGMSGGPIAISRSLTETQHDYYLLGVHLEGRSGLCLNKERFTQIKEIIEFFFLKSSLDESFFGVITQPCKQFTVTFENSIGATTKQFHNAIHSLRFAASLESLIVKSKTEDQAEIVTDETIELLTEALPSLRFLSSIRIDLSNANQLTGSNLEEFGIALTKLRDLTSLQFYVQNGKQLAGRQLTFFFNALSKFENLNSLAVTLINTEQVDDEAIKALGTLIYHSPGITLLKLHFQGLPKTTSPAFEQLVGNIKSLPKLCRLNITFFGLTFSDPIKKDLREHFKRLPQLSVM